MVLGQARRNTCGRVPRTSPSWGIISREPRTAEVWILHGRPRKAAVSTDEGRSPQQTDDQCEERKKHSRSLRACMVEPQKWSSETTFYLEYYCKNSSLYSLRTPLWSFQGVGNRALGWLSKPLGSGFRWCQLGSGALGKVIYTFRVSTSLSEKVGITISTSNHWGEY